MISVADCVYANQVNHSKGESEGHWNTYRGTIRNSRRMKKWYIESRRLNDEWEEGREIRGTFHEMKLSLCWDSVWDCQGAGTCHGRKHVRLSTRRFSHQFPFSSFSWTIIPQPGPYWQNDPGTTCFILSRSKGESTQSLSTAFVAGISYTCSCSATKRGRKNVMVSSLDTWTSQSKRRLRRSLSYRQVSTGNQFCFSPMLNLFPSRHPAQPKEFN